MKRKNLGAIIVACTMALTILSSTSILNFNVKANDVIEKNNEELTSKELLENILSDSSIVDVYLYNLPSDSIKAIKKDNNKLDELMSRVDYKETVISEYKEYDFKDDYSINDNVFESLKETSIDNLDKKISLLLSNDEVSASVEKDVIELAKIYFLECLMTSEEFVKDFTETEQEELNQAAYDKYLEKSESKLYAGMEDSIYELAIKSETNKEYCVTVTRGKTARVKTPKGTLVKVLINDYYGERWANATTLQFKKDYPNIKVLAMADNRYNCHSYAWYKADPSNTYWMNDPINYMFDGSYNMTRDILKDNKVTWVEVDDERVTFVEHSGIVNGIENNKVMVTSKWGQGPLVVHPVTYSPYVSKNLLYFTSNNK